MTRGNVAGPLVAAAIGLVGCLAVMVVLHRYATGALDEALEQRLLASGRSAALLFSLRPPGAELLEALREANALDAAYVLDGELQVIADGQGTTPRPADLLRVDPQRVDEALARGTPSVGHGYRLDELDVWTAYFPLQARSVLVLEAGAPFLEARTFPRSALWLGIALSGFAAVALALSARRTQRTVRERERESARSEAISRMAAIAAHEIRNPLAIIAGHAELLRSRSQDPAVTRGVASVLAEVYRLKALTQDLLELAADRELGRAPVELGPLVEAAASGARATHPEVTIEAQVHGPVTVEGDAGRLRQVLSNLIVNACQAQGGTGTVRIELRREGAHGVVRVSDEGPGIAPEDRARLFEPFFTTKGNGTGLGLALSRRLVERHGGTIGLVDGAGRGCTFELRLPVNGAARR